MGELTREKTLGELQDELKIAKENYKRLQSIVDKREEDAKEEEAKKLAEVKNIRKKEIEKKASELKSLISSYTDDYDTYISFYCNENNDCVVKDGSVNTRSFLSHFCDDIFYI